MSSPLAPARMWGPAPFLRKGRESTGKSLEIIIKSDYSVTERAPPWITTTSVSVASTVEPFIVMVQLPQTYL